MKERLDVLLVKNEVWQNQGKKAKAIIMSGIVYVEKWKRR